MGRLFLARPDALGVPRVRRVDTAQAALLPVETLEEAAEPRQAAQKGRRGTLAGLGRSIQWARALESRRMSGHVQSPHQRSSRTARPPEPTRSVQSVYVYVNRPVRTRMPGGV